jgi:hypothetical protein
MKRLGRNDFQYFTHRRSFYQVPEKSLRYAEFKPEFPLRRMLARESRTATQEVMTGLLKDSTRGMRQNTVRSKGKDKSGLRNVLALNQVRQEALAEDLQEKLAEVRQRQEVLDAEQSDKPIIVTFSVDNLPEGGFKIWFTSIICGTLLEPIIDCTTSTCVSVLVYKTWAINKV